MQKASCDTCDAQGVCMNRRPGRKACYQYKQMPNCSTCRKRACCPDNDGGQWCPNYMEEPKLKA